MPPVYETSCSQCGYRSGVFSEAYGAVWLDEPARLVVLAHPLEARILKDIGYSHMRLFREGRFVWVTSVLCAACGHLYERRRLKAPGGVGCVSTFVIGATLVGAALVADFSPLQSLAAGVCTTLIVAPVVEALAHWYTRRRFRERARLVDSARGCPQCSSTLCCYPSTSQLLPCPECRAAALSVTCVGRS